MTHCHFLNTNFYNFKHQTTPADAWQLYCKSPSRYCNNKPNNLICLNSSKDLLGSIFQHTNVVWEVADSIWKRPIKLFSICCRLSCFIISELWTKLNKYLKKMTAPCASHLHWSSLKNANRTWLTFVHWKLGTGTVLSHSNALILRHFYIYVLDFIHAIGTQWTNEAWTAIPT